MIALISGQAEEAFFEDWVAFVPKRKSEANHLPAIANTGQSIFIPAISAGPGVVVRQIFPSGSMRTVVLSYGTPGALAEVGSPTFPVLLADTRFRKPDFFLCHEQVLP